jgi:hypothetical protein
VHRRSNNLLLALYETLSREREKNKKQKKEKELKRF